MSKTSKKGSGGGPGPGPKGPYKKGDPYKRKA
jgi:hypothetical protein